MPDTAQNPWRTRIGMSVILLVPFATAIAAYAFLNHLQPGISDNYDDYREFWGGNPSEVFSHWLDMVLMSGGVAALSWLVIAEAFFRQRQLESKQIRHTSHICFALFLVLSGLIALVFDGKHGEGTVVIAYPVFFVPILISTWFLLRQFAARLRWRLAGVATLSLGFVVLHTAAQLCYEPSGTGGPNGFVLPMWLSCVGAALLWALVRSIRTGWLGHFCSRLIHTVRRPVVFGSVILILCAVGIPVTLYAKHTRRTHQDMSFAWLDELEAKLTDDFIGRIKRDHTPSTLRDDSKMPVSPAAHALLVDARIKGENELRIYVPVNQDGYIFLWGNDRFQYCDVCSLARGQTEQIDQDFIGALIANGGTHQTRLYSVLWSPYMAGRVLKDRAGNVKAICVINAP
jgi:4-amino-4-deoxy-L-arabinose transferase-like glycosyltransferase